MSERVDAAAAADGARGRHGPGPRRGPTGLAVTLACLSALAVPGATHADAPTRVLVGRFSGPSGHLAEAAVARGLSRDGGAEVLGRTEYDRACAELDLLPAQPRDYARLARAVDAAVIVDGHVTRRGRALLATATVRRGDTGEAVEELRVSARTPRSLARAVERAARRDAVELLGSSVTRVATTPAAGPDVTARRAIVRPFDGARAAAVRADVVRALAGRGAIVVDEADVARIAREAGVSLDDASGRAEVLRRTGASMMVSGAIERSGEGLEAELEIYGPSGSRAEELELEARNLPELGRAASRAVGAASARLLAPRGAPGEGAASVDPGGGPPPGRSEAELERETPFSHHGAAARAARAGDAERGDAAGDDGDPLDDGGTTAPTGAASLRLAAELRMTARDFSYEGDEFDELRGYSVGPVPAGVVSAEWFPFAGGRPNVLGHFGLGVSASLTPGFDSRDRADEAFPTQAWEASGGLVGHLVLGPLTIQPRASFLMQTFALDRSSPSGASPDLPDVRARALRAGLRVGVSVLEQLRLEADGGYLAVLDAGHLDNGNWFPNARSAAWDLELAAAYEVLRGMELVASVGGRVYAHDLHAARDADHVARSATDRYLAGALGLRYALGGS